MDVKGHYRIRFMDPLDKGDELMPREDRTKSLVEQYAKILGDAWMKEPQRVNWGHVKTYLQYVNKE
jgi:hypothetical protein